MSRSSRHGTLEWDTEASFCEVSTTYTNRAAMLGELDFSGLVQDKIDAERTVQYANDGTMPIRGHKSDSEFSFEMWLPGHGSATSSGTPTLQEHELLLGYFLGASSTGGAAGTATGGTATIPTTATESLIVGQGAFFGVKGDGRADGQAGIVGTDGAGSLTLLSDLPGAMNNGDVIYAATQQYFNESPTSLSLPTCRFRGLTANQQYAMRGCWPKSMTLTQIDNARHPRLRFTFGVADWDPVSATFPSATAIDTFHPAPSAGGSLVIQNLGTTTRATYAAREIELTVNLNSTPTPAPGGNSAWQRDVGATRGPTEILFSFVVDADNASASPTWGGLWDSDTQAYHVLYTVNGAANGKQVGIYMPNTCIVGRKPVQMSHDGIARERITMRAYTGTTTTSELTLSALRIFQG